MTAIVFRVAYGTIAITTGILVKTTSSHDVFRELYSPTARTHISLTIAQLHPLGHVTTNQPHVSNHSITGWLNEIGLWCVSNALEKVSEGKYLCDWNSFRKRKNKDHEKNPHELLTDRESTCKQKINKINDTPCVKWGSKDCYQLANSHWLIVQTFVYAYE